MIGKPYRSELLGKQHDRASFSSGVEILDRYLQVQAGQDRRRDLAAPYVLVDSRTERIVGYYTLNTFSIIPTSLPDTITRQLARYDVLPAIMIGRLAADRHHHGQGVGRRLLLDALARCLDISQKVAALAVVVDAKNDTARSFYEHHEFLRFADDPYRLYLLMRTVARIPFTPE